MAGGSALLKKRPLLLGGLALLIALAIAVSLAVTRPWASTRDRDDVAAPAAGDRVLQSVDVAMKTDGTLTGIGDTVVIARGADGKSDTYATTYDPTKVVDQLPVRVLTAYRTDKGSGTDLADLKGFSGRVTINLTVQNLTVKPQQIVYDAAGRSQTKTALVGAPLTVVASAALPGVDPATIVTAPAGATEDATGTNGVLSQSSDGTPQVQWASILAPPQLAPTANLRLVVDAKDFVVPTVDLSVQPGLVTDPSVGALIDSAFNPKNSDELALETRTIDLIGDVNDVLGRASGTITSVRKTLDASSKTLGTKTVASLTQDTKTISTSLKSSSDSIDSLGKDLKGSLQTTQSSTLQRMSETVSQLQDLIGDTSATQPTAKVTGSGCDAKVKAPTGGTGVYASMLQVTAQLDAYATTTDGCKAEMQATIKSTLGATDANGVLVCTNNTDTTSVACSLDHARDEFTAVTKAVDSSEAAADGLDPANLGGPLRDITDLAGQLTAVVQSTNVLLNVSPGGANSDQLKRAADAITAALITLGPADSQGVGVKTLADLAAATDKIHKDAVGYQTTATSMVAQNEAFAGKLCKIIGDGTTPGKLPAADVELLRAYLVTGSCPDQAGATTDLPPPDDNKTVPMFTLLTAQAEAWGDIAEQTGPDAEDQEIGKLLADESTQLIGLNNQLNAVRTQLGTAPGNVKASRDAVESVNKAAVAAQAGLVELGTSVEGTQTKYEEARAKLTVALAAAKTSAETASKSVDPSIKQVTEQGKVSSEQLGKAFDSSAEGITAAADALRDGTARSLKKQQDELADQSKDDQAELKSQTKAGLSQIAGSVTSSTRDIDSTRTSLTKDLNNVLLDLGNPKVPGKGLLGTLGKSARSADSADYQLGLASDTVSSYAAVRSQEVDGILLRQAQAEASLQRQAELPAFATDLPATTQHRTVYLFHLGGDR